MGCVEGGGSGQTMVSGPAGGGTTGPGGGVAGAERRAAAGGPAAARGRGAGDRGAMEARRGGRTPTGTLVGGTLGFTGCDASR